MHDFNEEFYNKVALVDDILEECLSDKDNSQLQKEIYESMSYSVMAGGKRLRPILVLEAYNLFEGKDEKEVYPYMAAIEMIHTYSLIHDDLPAMDNDDYRRGRLTNHKVYGEDMAILTGDGLLNLAYETMIKSVDEKNVSKSIKAMNIISNKAGVSGMIGGQVGDIKNVNKDMDIETLDKINELKTSCLIEGSLMMGATMAGASDKELESICMAGSLIGRAFQIQDDVLDVISDSKTLGKPVLSDEKNQKKTYVDLLGIDGAKEQVRNLSDKALKIIKELGNNEFLVTLIERLVNRDH
ncbi:MAG: polyprenyl synthetase family protein [Lachnospiraceae bacterium]|nr:polyprenyl synthetase family protein [Lachnospiraceae bacterium]MBQ5474823.1 polyprenyl synthetase family protein [Lachnospiraceae bacterium]